MLFSTSDTVDLVLIGGYVHSRTGVSLGPYANEMLADLNVQRAVLSVAGINERGYYNSHLLLVETERAMMRAADQVIVVADSTKFGRTSIAPVRVGRGGRGGDRRGDQREWRSAEDAGVKLVVAYRRRNRETSVYLMEKRA